MTRSSTLVLMLLLVSGTRTGWSQPTNADYAAGAELFQRGEYLAAAEKFKAAYEADSDAGYLFNIAQAYRFANECSLSARYYREFLAAMPSPPNVEQIREWLATEESCTERSHRETESKRAAQVDEHRSDAVTPVAEPPAGGDRRVLALGTGVVAAIAAGTAAYFTYDAHHLAQRREALCANGCVWSDVRATADDLDSRGRRASTLAIAGYATSAVALAGTIALYVSSRHRSSFALAPVGGGAMAFVTRR